MYSAAGNLIIYKYTGYPIKFLYTEFAPELAMVPPRNDETKEANCQVYVFGNNCHLSVETIFFCV